MQSDCLLDAGDVFARGDALFQTGDGHLAQDDEILQTGHQAGDGHDKIETAQCVEGGPDKEYIAGAGTQTDEAGDYSLSQSGES